NGTVALYINGSLVYTPNQNFAGADVFTYAATDGTSLSAAATVTINVSPVNDAPEAADDTYVTDEDTTLTVPLPGVLQNDSDVDDTVLTATLVNAPLNGTLEFFEDGSFQYEPHAD